MNNLNVRQESSHREQPLRPQLQQHLARYSSKGKGNKSKNELVGLHQDTNFLHSTETQSTKLQGNFQNGRSYMQVMYLIKC